MVDDLGRLTPLWMVPIRLSGTQRQKSTLAARTLAQSLGGTMNVQLKSDV